MNWSNAILNVSASFDIRVLLKKKKKKFFLLVLRLSIKLCSEFRWIKNYMVQVFNLWRLDQFNLSLSLSLSLSLCFKYVIAFWNGYVAFWVDLNTLYSKLNAVPLIAYSNQKKTAIGNFHGKLGTLDYQCCI